MMRIMSNICVSGLLSCLISVSFGGVTAIAWAQTDTPTPVPTDTPTPLATGTDTPIPTTTNTPTVTPSPTITPTPDMGVQPDANGGGGTYPFLGYFVVMVTLGYWVPTMFVWMFGASRRYWAWTLVFWAATIYSGSSLAFSTLFLFWGVGFVCMTVIGGILKSV